MIKRLICLPIYALFVAAWMTGVVPITYWLITGKDFANLISKIDNIWNQ